MMIKRGDIYYADLRPVVGSEQEVSVRCLLFKMMQATATALL